MIARRALEVMERSLGPSHPDVGAPLNTLATLLMTTQRYAEAEPLLRRAVSNYERFLGPNHPDVASALNNLAGLLYSTGRFQAAEPFARRALEIRESALGQDHVDVAYSLNVLGALLMARQQPDEAEPLLRRHLEILLRFSRAAGGVHPELEKAMRTYVAVLTALGWKEDKINRRLDNLVHNF